jgi:hypothetical protein
MPVEIGRILRLVEHRERLVEHREEVFQQNPGAVGAYFNRITDPVTSLTRTFGDDDYAK